MNKQDIYNLINKKNPTIFEIGCADGKDTIEFINTFGDLNIFCFEPEPKNFESLVNNLKDYKHFQAYNLAVSDKKGEKDFVVAPGCNTGLHSFYSRNGVPIKVKTIGLDDILNNFPKVSLLKIDTEGAEYEIILNSTSINKVKKIVGEYHNGITPYL